MRAAVFMQFSRPLCNTGYLGLVNRDRSTYWGYTMEKTIMTIGSVPISQDIVYRRGDGTYYSKRSAEQHVMVRLVCNSPCHWEDIENTEEAFPPLEMVEAECVAST